MNKSTNKQLHIIRLLAPKYICTYINNISITSVRFIPVVEEAIQNKGLFKLSFAWENYIYYILMKG